MNKTYIIYLCICSFLLLSCADWYNQEREDVIQNTSSSTQQTVTPELDASNKTAQELWYTKTDMIHLSESSWSYQSTEVSSVQYFWNSAIDAAIMRIWYDLVLNNGESYNAMVYFRGTKNFTQEAFETYTDKFLITDFVNVSATDDAVNSKYLWYGDAYSIAHSQKNLKWYNVQAIPLFWNEGFYFSAQWWSWVSSDIFYVTAPISENNYFSEVAIQILDTTAYLNEDIQELILQYINGLSLRP